MKKFIGLIFILVGLVFLLIPSVKNMYVKKYTNIALDENLSKENLKSNLDNSKEEFDYSAIEDVDIKSLIKASKNYNKDNIIGILLIPDLNIDLPIMKGVTNSNLLVGASTMKPNQQFGVGNFALAGHNMKNKKLLFGSLMDIEIGTVVYLSNGDEIFEYEIFKTEIVPDTQIDMIEDTKSENVASPIVSLMTCYQTSKSGKRFFAIGKLIDNYSVENI